MEVLLSQFIAPSCFPAEEICLPYPMVFLLGNLINRKDMIQNKYSEKGYRDVVLNINGTAAANVACSTSNLVIPCQRLKLPLHFHFPNKHFSVHNQIGDRFGSNACTLIAVKFGAFCFENKLDLSLLWNQLPDMWFNSFVNASVMEMRFMMSCIAILPFFLK